MEEKKQALVIIDMQKGFVNKYTMHLPKRILDYIDREGYNFDYIITTRYLNHENTACYIFEKWKECMDGSEDAELIDGLAGKYVNVDKDKYSCYNDDFKNIIRGLGITDVFLCGVNTGCCVLHSAFDMYNDLVSVYVIQDLCGSTSGPESHKAAIQVLGECITKQRIITSGLEGITFGDI